MRSLCLVFPGLIEELHEWVVDHEGNGHVQAHATQSGQRALVEPRKLYKNTQSVWFQNVQI